MNNDEDYIVHMSGLTSRGNECQEKELCISHNALLLRKCFVQVVMWIVSDDETLTCRNLAFLVCFITIQGSCGHGKPGKVMEFEKSISRPGKVMEN